MSKKRFSAKWQRLAQIVLVVLLLGLLSLSSVVAQDATDVLVWSLGYSGDYNDVLVERFNEAHDDVQIVYEDVLTGTFTENNQKVRIALDNEAGPHVLGGVDVGANLQALVSTGQVKDLTEYYRASGLIDRIPPNLLSQVTVEGRFYAIPQNLESVGIFYTKISSPNWSWMHQRNGQSTLMSWRQSKTLVTLVIPWVWPAAGPLRLWRPCLCTAAPARNTLTCSAARSLGPNVTIALMV